MKKYVIFVLFFCLTVGLYSQSKSAITFNGSLVTTFDLSHSKTYPEFPYYYSYKDPDHGEFSWGLKNLANLRLKANISEYLSFNLAFNIHTYSGSFADTYKLYYLRETASSAAVNAAYLSGTLDFRHGFFSIPFYYKSTYVGGFELERMSFKAGNDYFDIEAGLMKLSMGYGYVFSPTDLFNPRDPLDPDARPEGKLAVVTSFYPMPMWKIQAFSIIPDNPVDTKGYGFKFGTSTNILIKKVNLEFLYSMFMPDIDYHADLAKYNLSKSTNNDFTHIAGFSLKADIEIGLFIDMIYRFDQKAFYFKQYYGKDFKGYEGLEAALGIDYTLPGGKVYLLLEYMFYGSGMVDWDKKNLDELYTTGDWWKKSSLDRVSLFNTEKNTLSYLRHDYIYGLITVTVNDYLKLGTSYLFGADDQSAILTAIADINPFQSFSINVRALFPFDWKMLNSDWSAGEFGSTNLGFFQKYQVSVTVKF
jgi:hypothetical protein